MVNKKYYNISKIWIICLLTLLINYNISFADSEDSNNNNNKSDISVEQESSTPKYKLINDNSKKFKESDINTIINNLNSIFDKQKNNNGEDAKTFKIYTFIYDSPGKNIDNASTEVIKNYKLDSSIVPLIFIINLSNNEYKYIIDESIKPYISKGYLQFLADDILLNNNNVTFDSLNEFLIKISTLETISVQDKILDKNNLNVKIDDKHFSYQKLNATIIDSNKKDENNSIQEVSDKLSESKASYTLISLLLAFATIIVVFFIRKKKFKK